MKKILIVEDTLAIREEVFDILILEGYRVFEAKDGKKGLEIALKENPDLIISDILMPKMNGFEMFEKLKKNDKTKVIPLIFLSAKGEKEDIRTGMDNGAQDYLTKPININDLLSAVEKKVEKKLIIDKK
jgi:DNA-binding response OmpR family regulator